MIRFICKIKEEKRMKKLNRKGFTLIELLAVVVILAVLALTFGLCACSGDKKDGKEKETKIKTDVLAATIIDNIKNNAKVSDFTEKFDAGNIEYVYLNLDMNVVEDAAGIYINDQKVFDDCPYEFSIINLVVCSKIATFAQEYGSNTLRKGLSSLKI